MDFEFTRSIEINSENLRKMYLYVKKGGDFQDIFDWIMSGYEEEDYYNSQFIFDDVKKEIDRRIRQSRG